MDELNFDGKCFANEHAVKAKSGFKVAFGTGYIVGQIVIAHHIPGKFSLRSTTSSDPGIANAWRKPSNASKLKRRKYRG